jgi:hypothetical protein
MASERDPREVDLRNRARSLGYDLFFNDRGYVLARRLPGLRRVPVIGGNEAASLDDIERWLEEHHPG